MFTGDAYKSNFDNVVGYVHKNFHARLLHNAIDSRYRASLRVEQYTNMDEFFKNNRRLLQKLGVLFAPHHGTDSNGSQDIPSYMWGLKNPPATCVINSFVEGSDHNPVVSSIRMVPRDKEHQLHAVTFWRGGKRGDTNASKDFKFTSRRIYVTEAAPGGAYWFRSDGEIIEMYNAYRRSFFGENSEDNIGFQPILYDYTEFNKQILKVNASIIDDNYL